METNAPKRRDNKKSLRVKVISLGNAEVGKVSENQSSLAVSSSMGVQDTIFGYSVLVYNRKNCLFSLEVMQKHLMKLVLI